jgi:hypothetical protein
VRPKFQSRQSVRINTPLEKVWEFGQDLSRIAEYHPRVNKVDLISGKRFRETGAAYKCNLSDGKNSCIEKDIEIIPMEKIVTVFVSDTMGITKLLPDYIVEFLFKLKIESLAFKFFHKKKSSQRNTGDFKCNKKSNRK